MALITTSKNHGWPSHAEEQIDPLNSLSRGLLSYIPLNGIARDLVPNRVLTVSAGAAASGFAFRADSRHHRSQEFDGVGDDIAIQNGASSFETVRPSGSEPRTHMCTLSADTISGSFADCFISFNDTSPSTAAGWQLYVEDNGISVGCVGGRWNWPNVISAGTKVYHVAIRFAGTNLGDTECFIDGKLAAGGHLEGGSNQTINTQATNGQDYYLGSQNGSNGFDGTMANVGLWGRALTDAEIRQHALDPHSIYVRRRRTYFIPEGGAPALNNLRQGANTPSAIHQGANTVDAIYQGSTLLWGS